ncbi:hypothetical protein PENCOP_c002G07502 [Penicillium coprophilum]|uniref:Uncharacterized protein n=1 Tax=Penicillium coprophilum TaxID=36646 RepID=A0A1V6V2H4_9EURO|nr:hypothetical protein PENCOP_c002G07502 [Penicillium coprophilum]
MAVHGSPSSEGVSKPATAAANPAVSPSVAQRVSMAFVAWVHGE